MREISEFLYFYENLQRMDRTDEQSNKTFYYSYLLVFESNLSKAYPGHNIRYPKRMNE